MSYLTLDADRLVRDAVDAYLEGKLRSDSGGDCVFATRNSQYRVVDGTVLEASDTSLMGAELVGWLCEELGQPLIEPRWRPYGRAIFVERKSRHVVVTSRTLTRNTISGNVSPVPPMRRRPSVIPPSPPIPVLKSASSAPLDGSPTPFRVPDAIRQAALTLESHESVAPDPGPSERPTRRPPSDEATVATDRASYEDLVEASRTPTWSGGPMHAMPKAPSVPPPAPTRPVHLPPVVPPPKPTMMGVGAAPNAPPTPSAPAPPAEVVVPMPTAPAPQLDGDGIEEISGLLELEPDEPSQPR
ncbi:MAG: hypothetical protein IPM79_16540 [Polyangiaceae bacterium]|nr:hypothetical protein [Polyangiaceae bacterium]